MSDKEKIKQYLESKGISKNKFYITTGLSIGFLDSGNSLGVDKLKIIVNCYPDLSLRWLVLGEGDMIEEEEHKKGEEAIADSSWMKEVIQNQASALNRMTAKLERMEKEKENLSVQKDVPSAFTIKKQ